jgi:hypothetical protein
MERALDFEPFDDIQHLLAEGILEPDTPAYVVARQAISLGIGSLSNRQRLIYDRIIAPALEALALEERRGAAVRAA